MADKKMIVEILAKDSTKAGVKSAEAGLSSLTKAAGVLGIALSAGALKNAADMFIRQEQAVFQLEQRLKSTGGVAGLTSQQLQRMATSLQRVSVYGDEAIIEMQSLLLTFTQIRGEVFTGAQQAILNVAKAMGTDLKSAAIQVGKALNDPAGQLTALSRSGIQFSAEQKETIRTMQSLGNVAGAQKVILAELETQFGGASGRNGLGGALQGLNGAFGDIIESIGKAGASGTMIGAVSDLEHAFIGVNYIVSDTVDALNGFEDRISAIAGNKAVSMFLDSLIPFREGIRVLGEYGALRDKQAGQRMPIPGRYDAASGQYVPLGSNPPAASGGGSTFTGWGQPGMWEIEAQNKINLENAMAYNRQRFALEIELGTQMRDVWQTQADDQIDIRSRTLDYLVWLDEDAERRKQAAWSASLAGFSQLQQGMYTLAQGNSKSLMKLAQLTTVPLTLAKAYQAAVGAASDTPGPIWVRLAAYAAALGQGLAAYATVRSVFGGGDSAGAPGTYGGGTPGSPVVTDTTTTQPTQRSVTVIVEGNLIGNEQYVEDYLIPAIRSAEERHI